MQWLIGTVSWRADKEDGLVNGVPECRYFVDGLEVRESLKLEGTVWR